MGNGLGHVVGYLVEELVVIATIVINLVIVKLVAVVAMGVRCSGGRRGGPAGNVGVIGQQRRLFQLEPEVLWRHHRLPRQFFCPYLLVLLLRPNGGSRQGRWSVADSSGRRQW